MKDGEVSVIRNLGEICCASTVFIIDSTCIVNWLGHK